MTDPRQVSQPRVEPGDGAPTDTQPFDPLKLCVFATVALLGWVLGPWALLVFSLVAALGYARARREGLLRSRCKLGDTRLVLLYLVALAVAAAYGIYVSFR